MNKKETSQIIAILMASYPNFLNNKSSQEVQATINVWHEMLQDYNYKEVSVAIKIFITQSSGGFAPSIGQVIDKIISFKNQGIEMTEQEAWNLISKAIRNSAYHAQDEFEKLPKVLQRLTGSPTQLKEWGQMPAEQVQSVVASNLMRSYKAKAASERETQALPNDIKALMSDMSDRLKIDGGN